MILTGTHQSIAQVRGIEDLKYVLYQMVDAINRLSGNANTTNRTITLLAGGGGGSSASNDDAMVLNWMGM